MSSNSNTMPTHTTVSLYLDGATRDRLAEMLESKSFTKKHRDVGRSRSSLIQFLINKGYENLYKRVKKSKARASTRVVKKKSK